MSLVRNGILFYFCSVFQFSKDSGNNVDECKLRVSYVPPPQPPSPVREGSEEGSSPRASVSDNGTVNQSSEFNNVSKDCWLIMQVCDMYLLLRKSRIILFLYCCRCRKGCLINRRAHQRLLPKLTPILYSWLYCQYLHLFCMILV